MSTDTRVAELEALSVEEGFTLPMAADLIVFFEDRGYCVDMATGEAHKVTVELSPNAQALCHLYGEAIDFDAELEDYREWIADQDFWRSGEF